MYGILRGAALASVKGPQLMTSKRVTLVLFDGGVVDSDV